MDEDDFEPRLGRMRAGGSKPRGFRNRVIAAAARAGAVARGNRGRRFDGSRIGRGAGVARVLRGDRHAGLRARRAMVKTRLVRLAGKGVGAAAAHLRYIQRDGVTREGAPGQLYSAGEDVADGPAFLARGAGDRHQFRFIVSAEDGDQYQDLKPLVRRLMAQAEIDLGTKLDWVAVDHFNTAHPHSHIMLRGVDDRGANLVVARDYIAHGLRERAAELVTLDLGPRTTLEIEARLRQDIGAERLTGIDRKLIRDRGAAGIVAAADRDPFEQALRAGRLAKLGSLGLAADVGGGRWQIADGLEDVLRRMGERGDIIRTMQRELGALGGEHEAGAGQAAAIVASGVERMVYDSAADDVRPIVGKLLHRGLADELADRHFLLVDGVDGRTWYVDIGKGEGVPPIPTGAIVEVAPRAGGAREVDRTIAAVAAAHGGRYDIDAHLAHDPNASEAFAEAHVRRLEAMRRAGAGVEREADGGWRIAVDHVARAAAYEARQMRDRPVAVATLSALPLDRLGRAETATWLDHELVAEVPTPVRDTGFGREVRAVQVVRRQWLVEQQLASEDGGRVTYRAGLIAALERRELLRVAGQLSEELGLPFVEARSGARIDGALRKPVELVSGRFALVERSRDFTLVPWRPVLERRIGQPVAGIMRDDGVSWSFGRARGGPSIT